MKQKSLKLLLPLAIVSLVLSACGKKTTPSEKESDSGQVQESESSSEGQQSDSGVTTNSYTIKFVNDDGTLLQESEVDEGVMPVYNGATPEKAADDEYTYTFDKWVPDIVAAVADATYTASYTSEAVVHPDPTIVIDGEKTLNVNAGETIALPSVTATDHKGRELEVEFEDEFGGSTIKNGQFTSKVAGAHNIIFYTEDEFGGTATDEVVVNVVPANAETFEVSASENNPANITAYSTYKENFAKGTNSPYYKSLVDGRESAEISATSDAIAGNSLVFNARLLLGNAAYCLFGKVINDVVLRDTQVTYTISFDYKAINSDGCFNGIYFSPSYDTDAGSVGKDTKLNPVVGEVVHFEETYSRFVFPGTSPNCYLRIFNYNASNPNVDSYVAVDNFVITAKQETQITYVTPTTEQLLSENGFTWDMASATADISNTSFVAVDEVSDATAKAAMKANDLFGENVIHLMGQADHLMKSLNGTNVISGKILEVSFWYYAVKDLGHVIFMGCNGGNPTIQGENLVRETVDGNVKKITAKLLLSSYSGVDVVNFYGGSASDEIYIAKITAKLYDYVPPQEVVDKPSAHIPTTAELAAGFTWDMVNNFIDFDNSEYVDVANMEDASIKEAIQGNAEFGSNVLRFTGGLMCLGVGAANLTPNYILTVDIDYYCVEDGFQYFILRGASDTDNVTQPGSSWTRTVVSGNFKHFHYEGVLPRSLRDTTMTTYNGSVNILIGKVTISCSEPTAPEFENFIPTTEQLAAGVTWIPGSADAHPGFDSCAETVKVSKIQDETVKAALQGNNEVGEYVQHVDVTGGPNAIFLGLNGSNVPSGKELVVNIFYYAVTDYQYFLLNGGAAGEKETISGNFKKWSITVSPTTGFQYVSMYNNGNGYVYKMTALLSDLSIPEGETPNGHKEGEQINIYSSGESWVSTNKNGYVVSDYDGAIENLSSMEGMGTAPKKIDITNPSGLIEISQGHSTQMEIGIKYKLVVYFYNVNYAGNMYIQTDNNQFHQLPSFATGYHKYEVEFTPTAACNWLCLYSGTNTESGTVYMGDLYVVVLEVPTPKDTTPAGYEVGDQIDIYTSGESWVSTDKNGYVVSDYDGAIENLSSMEGMGSAPKRIDIANPSGLIEISQGHSSQMEIGVRYKLVVYFYNVNYAGNMYIQTDNNQFHQLPSFATGYHKYEVEFTPTATCNWLCLYSGTNTESGTVYMGNLYVEVLAIN